MGMDLNTLQPPKDVPAAYRKEHSEPGYYRFNVQGMASMRALMDAAQVLSHEAAPALPDVPDNLSEDRRKNLLAAVYGDEKALAALSKADAALAKRYAEALRTGSKTPGRVPSFKFESNAGWIVTPDECRTIAKALRALATRVSVADARAASAAATKSDAQLTQAIGFDAGVRLDARAFAMSPDDLKSWLLDWADYNTIASFSGGYSVE